MNFLKKFGSHSVGYSGTEEHLMTAAKEMGKELYAHLEANERRHKLDAMVLSNKNFSFASHQFCVQRKFRLKIKYRTAQYNIPQPTVHQTMPYAIHVHVHCEQDSLQS